MRFFINLTPYFPLLIKEGKLELVETSDQEIGDMNLVQLSVPVSVSLGFSFSRHQALSRAITCFSYPWSLGV